MKDHLGKEMTLWSERALQVASFYWRKPWWELSMQQIAEAWGKHLRESGG